MQQRPASRLTACACPAYPVSPVLPRPSRIPRGRNREEPMTTTEIILLSQAIGQIIAAVAQLIAALKRRRW
jgi:hypothetical protein